MSGARLSQTGARCRRCVGGSASAYIEGFRWQVESGRNPRVRPVPEPEMSREAVDATGEVLRGGCVAVVDGGAAMVFSMEAEAVLLRFLAADGDAAMVLSMEAEAVLLGFLAAEVVREDMLREARKRAGGETFLGRHIEPAVKGGCSASSVLVTRGIVAAILYSCNFPRTGALR